MSTAQQLVSILEDDEVSYEQIANRLGCSRSTARDHMASLKDSGESVGSYNGDGGTKFFYLRSEEAEHPSNNNKQYAEKTKKKRQKSKKLNEHMGDMEARLTSLLNNSQPAVADGPTPIRESHEDVVIHRTDAHFGDQIEDEFGNVVFSPEIGRKREECVTDKVMDLVERQSKAGIKYDTANLLLGGDCVTGEHTYANQLGEVVLSLDEQIDMAFEVYMEQIQRLASRFPQVKVVCQPGNHGELEAKYSSGANADRLLYMMMDEATRRDENLDNVTFVRNDATRFTNFRLRNNLEEDKKRAKALGLDSVNDLEEGHRTGWKFHLRHGDDSLEHIGTSAGKKRWYNWMLRHEFDQAYRGHYHKHEIDTIHNDVKCIMTGSPKPPDSFEEKIAEWSQPTAFIHGVSDTRAKTWNYEVSFDN